MRWEDERYVRVYTRDTVGWLRLSWDAQALLMQLLRKANRKGELPLEGGGLEAVAIILGRVDLWESRIRPALEELLRDGVLVTSGHQQSPDALVFRNFVQAQETRSTDAQRKRDQRERDSLKVPKEADVTSGHQVTKSVTPAVPCRAVPSVPETPLSTSSTPLELSVQELPGVRLPDDALRVFEHWKRVMPKPRAIFDAKRRRAVEGRLKDGYPPERLCRAVDGCAASAWHRGENDRRQAYDDLSLICRDAEHVDRFIGMAEQPQSPQRKPSIEDRPCMIL